MYQTQPHLLAKLNMDVAQIQAAVEHRRDQGSTTDTEGYKNPVMQQLHQSVHRLTQNIQQLNYSTSFFGGLQYQWAQQMNETAQFHRS